MSTDCADCWPAATHRLFWRGGGQGLTETLDNHCISRSCRLLTGRVLMPRLIINICACLFLIVSATSAVGLKSGKKVEVSSKSAKTLRPGFSLTAGDTCIVRHDAGFYWRINGWVIGNELYKSYLNPEASCPLPYPFTVYEINMPMIFDATTPLIVSVDVEAADFTDPNCPAPGELLAISSQYQFTVPGAGVYDIWIPLDSPVTVNEPFFVGFFIGNTFASGVNPAIITDSVPTVCTSYNIWDTTIGYVDLGNNHDYNFPGRLVLYAKGAPGGTGSVQPPPDLTLISPDEVDTLFGYTTLWAWEKAGSKIIDYVVFEARPSGGSYTEIGRDFDGRKTLRDGVNIASSWDGFSYYWDFSTRPEGVYTVRATAFDTSGRSSADSASVYLEPTPPLPEIVSPNNGDDFCPYVQLLMSLFDENFTRIDAYLKEADTFFTLNLLQLNQSNYGDANGNPLDGNHVSNDEFGENYSGPVAATQAIRVWYDRGYRQFMKQGLSDIPIDIFVEMMSTNFSTRTNHGTYDENLVQGLHQLLDPFGITSIDFYRGPDYFTMRTWLEDEERSVILGLSDNPGMWVAVDGFSGWKDINGQYLVRIANPASGTIENCLVRNISGSSEIQIGSTWHSIDIMVSILVKNWGVSRQLIGSDNDATNGWVINWTSSGLTDQSPAFFRAIGYDASNLSGGSAVLLRNDCANFYVKGDFTGDLQVNLLDLVYLIDFVLNGGPPPVGGAGRSDANCDNYMNITDVVYLMNFMFGTADTPCY